MATTYSIARPYAQAAYEFARAKKELPAWSSMLHVAAQIVERPEISKLLSNTRISAQQWFSLCSDLLASYLDQDRKNFLRLITENRRLEALPAIAELFLEYEAQDNLLSEVEVTTAVPLDKKQELSLADKLSKIFNHKVNLRCVIDEHILGGAIVRAGDKVIDGSIRGQLSRLLEFAIR